MVGGSYTSECKFIDNNGNTLWKTIPLNLSMLITCKKPLTFLNSTHSTDK